MSDYLKKIEQRQNGSYTWMCSIDVEYYRHGMRMGLNACLGIAVFLLVFGAILSIPSRDWESFLIVAGCTAVFLLITAFFFGLAFSAKDPRESYEMWDDLVKSGSGKSAVWFDYKKAKKAIFCRKYIELRGKTKRMRIYAPEEDFDFVRSYIMNRLPGSCDIKFE